MPTKLPPSIFNDVVGPVMRGPSSSHSAASVRIGRIARDLCGGDPEQVLVEFDTHGSLPTTHKSQGSDMGLFGGLLGWDADDERLPDSERALADAGVALEIRYVDLHDPHPNTYRLTLTRAGVRHRLVAVSTGGGMIEVVEIDGCEVSLFGDYDVTLVEVDGNGTAARERLLAHGDVVTASGHDPALVAVCGQTFVGDEALADVPGVRQVRRVAAVLPVRSRKGLEVPFLHASEMLQGRDPKTAPLSTFALEYERARGGLDDAGVLDRMRHILQIVRQGVQQGLAGTEYDDRILPRQSHRFREMMEQGLLLDGG
ncbi:MAG: serine dehydratase, partial [Planctomycetes bacterium]|nr:serine dehydratase [Planctomycetota bacterium]